MTDSRADGELATAPSRAPTRVVGIDLGERRIGVSVSDSQRVLATPHSVITRSVDVVADRRAIAALASELGAGLVVIGLPLTLAGERGRAASAAAAEAAAIAQQLDVPVVLHDERLTTVEADRRRSQPPPVPVRPGAERPRPPRPARPGAGKRARRPPIDAAAATVLLQAWLDKNRSRS